MSDINYDELDPDIRETVRRIRAWGFNTTDSGDGHSKVLNGYPPEEVLDRPHVVIVSSPNTVIHEAEILYQYLTGEGVPMAGQSHALMSGEKIGYVEASFDPGTGESIIYLWNVTDNMWP